MEPLAKGGYETILSLIGQYLIYDYDFEKMVEFMTVIMNGANVYSLIDAIRVIMSMSRVYLPGDPYQSDLLEFMPAIEVKRKLSKNLSFHDLADLGSIYKLPGISTAEVENFKQKNITHLYHLIGHYFVYQRDPDLIEVFLEDFVGHDKIFDMVNFIHTVMVYQVF